MEVTSDTADGELHPALEDELVCFFSPRPPFPFPDMVEW
jgi:hypothetical protein